MYPSCVTRTMATAILSDFASQGVDEELEMLRAGWKKPQTPPSPEPEPPRWQRPEWRGPLDPPQGSQAQVLAAAEATADRANRVRGTRAHSVHTRPRSHWST